MKNGVILPVNPPLITSFTGYAHGLSILVQDETVLPWIFNQFVQIRGFKKDESTHLFFNQPDLPLMCPWIETKKVDSAEIETSIIEFIFEQLQQGFYINVTVDHFFLQPSSTYQNNHFPHDILIYGYDEEAQVFYSADFFTSKYSFETLPFDDLVQAYQGVRDFSLEHYNRDLVFLYRYNQPSNISFDSDGYIEQVADYLHSRSSYNWFEGNDYFDSTTVGLQNYEFLCDMVNSRILEGNSWDIRPFHLLYDHKQMLLIRMKYLISNGIFPDDPAIISECELLKNKTGLLRNKIGKSVISKKWARPDLIAKINELREMDEKVMSTIYDRLKAVTNGA